MKVQEGPLVHIKVSAHPRSRFIRKGCDGEEKKNGENSGLVSSLPIDRLMATDCNTKKNGVTKRLSALVPALNRTL